MRAAVKSLESTQSSLKSSIRCSYFNARGHRCRLPLPDNSSQYCINHARLLQRRELAEAKKLAAELLGNEGFDSRKDFADVFLRLFDAIASKRLSRRDGAVLAYTASRALQCFPPLRPENNFTSPDGRPLNAYGLPIPPPVHYKRDSVTGEWRQIPAAEAALDEERREREGQEKEREQNERQEQSRGQESSPSEDQSDYASQEFAESRSHETQSMPSHSAPVPQPYVPPPNPHENPFGPYLTDPRPRHLRNLHPYRHRL